MGFSACADALRPLHQSIDSQIHETLLDALDIYAFATPEPPYGASSDVPPAVQNRGRVSAMFDDESAAAYRPYTAYDGSDPPASYSVTLSEPDFFPAGSEYHGLVSVAHDLPSTIPKLASAARGRPPPKPAVFFLQPLEGDVVTTSSGELDAGWGDEDVPDQTEGGSGRPTPVTVTAVVHNLPIWNPDAEESEPKDLARGHLALELNGHPLVRCGRRYCSVAVGGLPPGRYTARATLFGPPLQPGRRGRGWEQGAKNASPVGDPIEVTFWVCEAGERCGAYSATEDGGDGVNLS
mmetsp:Transcript_6059/g.19559  ORF Transcript_6059/g.19559 Transcript_6059/m.19559 type:complete len:294 (+) Transcript_6059:754-1635(+)